MKPTLLALLLATSALWLTPPTAADTFCVNDICADIPSGPPEGESCPSTHNTVTGVWHYILGDGTIRDLPVEGTFYLATWSYSHFYEATSTGACRETAYSCRVQVSDGSHYQYLQVGTASAANGAYKGVFTNGGSLECDADSAELHTYGAFLIAIHGYGSRVG